MRPSAGILDALIRRRDMNDHDMISVYFERDIIMTVSGSWSYKLANTDFIFQAAIINRVRMKVELCVSMNV